MDMKINKETLRREREQRAWTQSHLAEVADLSMRTVQRIERTGDASMESASALAAALNLELAVLMQPPVVADQPFHAKPLRYKLWGAIGLLGSTIVALGWWSNAMAEQVMISLSIETAENTYSNMMLLNDVGEESEMKLDDRFRMLFSTSRTGEDLLVSARIYHLVNGESQLISSPAMLVKDQAPASMKIGIADGQELNLQLVADF
jgi:transcriptional regulator with XRE-family HTH domain